MRTGKVVVVCQWDDSALYINGRLVNGGDSSLVNGAVDALKRLKIHITYKRLKYDIWRREGFENGWPKKLSDIPELLNS
jgi:hypothetical protein